MSKPDAQKLVRFKSRVVVPIDATSTFGMKIKIEKVGGNRKEATVSCLRQLCFDEKKMRFSREVVFYRLKIRSKSVNVVEVIEEKAEAGVKTFWVDTKGTLQPGEIYGSFPRRGF
ncbi:hypothetical protein E2C01_053193 [Portunus trituberculatus]|uniref:Uncharacterized protein n=1 Tax=Portunus trituberculatus TaxID=210409 RepID=A0A5B7GPN9_PORTR|nr:hypothetical protein [Portunus trituberculatus]